MRCGKEAVEPETVHCGKEAVEPETALWERGSRAIDHCGKETEEPQTVYPLWERGSRAIDCALWEGYNPCLLVIMAIYTYFSVVRRRSPSVVTLDSCRGRTATGCGMNWLTSKHNTGSWRLKGLSLFSSSLIMAICY